MIIAIPSRGRAGRVRSLKWVPSAYLFVPEVEVQDYVDVGYERVIAVPTKFNGITKTRNFILDWALNEARDPRVVMVDDDALRVGWVKLYMYKAEHIILTPEQVLAEFDRLFDVAQQAGVRLWGLATHSALKAVYSWMPFRWRCYVTGSCMGMFADAGLRFDESFPVKEDYELCLRVLKEDKYILNAQHWYWSNSHWKDKGGCSIYRTAAMEQDCINRLMRMYPGQVRQCYRGGSQFAIDLIV